MRVNGTQWGMGEYNMGEVMNGVEKEREREEQGDYDSACMI